MTSLQVANSEQSQPGTMIEETRSEAAAPPGTRGPSSRSPANVLAPDKAYPIIEIHHAENRLYRPWARS